MARKLRLTSEVSYDYSIFGVSCHLKDYRFAFFLNDKLSFSFKRKDDLVFTYGEEKRAYSFFIYPHPDERRSYYLVSNYNEAGRLIPSEKGVDFFIIADDLLPAQLKKSLLSKVQSVPQVQAAYEIPKGKVKNLEVIFEEIEMHLL